MTASIARRMVEVSRAEALWLLESASQGRLVYFQREIAVVRPAVHVMQYGHLIVRTPAQETALADQVELTYQADEIRGAGGTGWTVTMTRPAELVSDADEAAHYRRTLQGWAHGPHDTLVRIRPQAANGFRLASPEAR
ncbi:pyridoxamine 5'-phosphate oxidase family protein [Streptomyces sp. NPDC005151]